MQAAKPATEAARHAATLPPRSTSPPAAPTLYSFSFPLAVPSNAPALTSYNVSWAVQGSTNYGLVLRRPGATSYEYGWSYISRTTPPDSTDVSAYGWGEPASNVLDVFGPSEAAACRPAVAAPLPQRRPGRCRLGGILMLPVEAAWALLLSGVEQRGGGSRHTKEGSLRHAQCLPALAETAAVPRAAAWPALLPSLQLASAGRHQIRATRFKCSWKAQCEPGREEASAVLHVCVAQRAAYAMWAALWESADRPRGNKPQLWAPRLHS